MILLFESANFDEKVFDEPETVRYHPLSRTTTWRSASARTSASGTSWPASSCRSCRSDCCKRLPDMRLASDDELPLRPANFVSGLEKMPVKFSPVQPLAV